MKTDQLYRPILAKAWSITKKFKALWFLGFFAALATSGEFEVLFRALSDPELEDGAFQNLWIGFSNGWQEGISLTGDVWLGFYTSLTNHPLNLVLALLILAAVVAFILFIIWLSVVSQIGLIHNVSLLNKNKKTTINEGIGVGIKNFWPVLAIDLTLKIILGFAVFILGRELILLNDLALTGRIVYYLSFIIFVFLAVIIAFLVRYQILYVVLKNKPFFQAMDDSWELFKRNWLVSLEMAFILFIVFFATTIIVTFITTILTATTMVVLPFYLGISVGLKILIAAVTFLLAVALVIFTTAVLSVFEWSCWTILFTKLSASDGVAKIVRTYDRLASRISGK